MKSEQLLKKIAEKVGILKNILKVDSKKQIYWELSNNDPEIKDSADASQDFDKVKKGIRQIYMDYIRNLIINGKSFNTFKQWLEWLRVVSEEEAQRLSALNQIAKRYLKEHFDKLEFRAAGTSTALGTEEVFLFSIFLQSELGLSEKSLYAAAVNYPQGLGDTFTTIFTAHVKPALMHNHQVNPVIGKSFTRHYVCAGEYYAAGSRYEFSCVDSKGKPVAVKHKKIPATGLVKVNEGRAKVLELGGCVSLTEFAANLPAEMEARNAELEKMTGSKVIEMIDKEQDQSQREFESAKEAFGLAVNKLPLHLDPPKWWRNILIIHKYVDKIAKLPEVGLPRYTQALRKMTEFLQNKSKVPVAEVSALVEFYYTSLVLNRQDKLNALVNSLIFERYSDESKESTMIAHKLRTIIFKHLEAIASYEPHHFNVAIVVKEFYKGLKQVRVHSNEAVENYLDRQIEVFEDIQKRQSRQIHSQYQEIISAVKECRRDIFAQIRQDKLQGLGSGFFGLFGMSKARAASAIMFKMEYLNQTLVEFMKSPGKLVKHLIAILENNHDPMDIKKVFEINLKKYFHPHDVISLLKKLNRAIDISIAPPVPKTEDKSEETHSYTPRI